MKKFYFLFLFIPVLIVPHVFAGSSELTINEVFSVQAASSPVLGINNISDSSYNDNTHTSFVDFSTTITSQVRSLYATGLYANGRMSYRIDVPISLPTGFLYRGYDFSVDYSNTDSCYIVIHSSYLVEGTLSFLVSVCCDNAYLPRQNSYIGNFTINVDIHTATTIDYLPTSTYGTVSNPILTSAGNNIQTSVHPVTTGGLGGVISDAVLFGLQQYNINDNLSALASLLAIINQTNTTMYNQIISQLVSNAQNDNRLMSGLQSLLTNYMVYENQDLAEMLYRYVYVLFPSFMNAGQSEASEANANASNAANSMDDVASSLEVARPDIDRDIAKANDFLTPDVVSGQGDLFFWLRGDHILVIILVISVSMGLMGFILYGKGG